MRRRSLQIASNIQRELQARLARGLSDPRIKGLITVTRVELSDDLKHAKAFVTVMPDEHAKITMHGLVSATGRLRKDVMDRIHIKEMPALRFVYDEGLKAQMEVMSLLERDKRERGWTTHKDSPAPGLDNSDGQPGAEEDGAGGRER